MTADPTAPKIDTTAPERLTLAWGGNRAMHLDVRTYGGTWTQQMIVVDYVPATLAAAQTAAAVREMREALQRLVENLDEGDFISITRIEEGRSALAATADGQAALDRLLEADRQDERTAIAAYIGMSPAEVTDRQYHMEAIRTGRYRDDPLMQRGGMMEGQS